MLKNTIDQQIYKITKQIDNNFLAKTTLYIKIIKKKKK